jgi:drug/metabolite transporter (DMT)-like permease
MTWAVGASLYSRLSGRYSVFAVNFTRALFGLPLFFVSALAFSGGLASFRGIEGHHLFWFVVSMICSYGLGDAMFMWSTRTLGAPGALAVSSVYPLWTSAVGLLRGETLSMSQLLGVIVTVGGVIVVILNAPEEGRRSRKQAVSEQEDRSYVLGVALAIGTSFFWAGNTFAVQKIGKELDLMVVNSVRMAMALGLSAGFGALLAPKKPLLLPRGEVLKGASIFILESFIGSGLFIYGLAHSTLAVGSTLSSLAPVVSVPVALAMGIERFSLVRAAGIAAVVGGLALLVAG